MSHLSVPLTAISLDASISDVPLKDKPVLHLDRDLDYQRIWTLEWFWGLSKGSLPLSSDLNSFEMRADMLDSYNADGWRLIPTPDTLKKMEAMLRHNICADDASRKVFTKEFSTPTHEYQFIPVSLSVEGRRPTIYVDVGDAAPRAFDYPYNDLPTVQSRAHPFFVMYTLEDFTLGGCRLLKYPWLRSINSTILRVTRLWRGAPPAEFRYGPDLPLEHRHPGSIKGDADRSSRLESCEADARDSNDASNDQGRLDAVDADHHSHSTSSLGKRKRAAESPADLADAPPRLCARTLAPERTKDLYSDRSAVAAWVAGVEPYDVGLRTSPASAIAEADAELARYVQEPLREPHEVMRTGRRIPQGSIPPSQERDTSRFTSCNWAEQKCCIYLWGYRDVSRQP